MIQPCSRIFGLLTVALGLATAVSNGQPADKTALPVVSYSELGKLVRSHKGKVVVVYFWADY